MLRDWKRITGFLLLSAPALAAQILTSHDYDAVSDAVISWRIQPGFSASQSFRIPRQERIGGFRVKLRRWGNPDPIEYRIGGHFGSKDFATGTIAPEQINPWFESWAEVRFRFPITASVSQNIYLQLKLSQASSGAYEWFGTASAGVARPEFSPQFLYTDNFSSSSEGSAIFENPVNIDYGLRTASYAGGSAFDALGDAIPAIDFAFQIEGTQRIRDTEEQRFAFIGDITGPLYSHSLRNADARPKPGEITIKPSWALVNDAHGPVIDTAASEFREFMRVAMQTQLKVHGSKRIEAGIGCETPPNREEGFEINSGPNLVRVCGYDERGAMQGMHYLEALMKIRHGPFLPRGKAVHAPRFSPRITSAPFYSKLELDTPIDQYTDGLLGRITRGGFNAIWVWGDLDEIAHSDIYPELDHGVSERQAKLRNLISRSARYGIDVYLYLANRPMPEAFFERHPNVRGSAMRAYGGVNVLCTSTAEVQQHFRSAMHNLMTAVPALKGVILIVGGEGFMHCYTRRNTCPRCSKRSAPDVVAELSATILEGVRSASASATVAIWPYSASNTWSKNDVTQSELLEKMPAGATWLTEFAKEGAISFGGITIPAYDYPISIVGPSARFVEQSVLARQRQLSLWVKTEHAIALEFVQTPYIPVFFQWSERFHHIGDAPGISGEFANWMHYGFMPTPATELFYWNIWDRPDDETKILNEIALGDFGAAASVHVLRAWRMFSVAIQQYPFSGPMAMGVIQAGPSHPLFFDPKYRPAHGAGRQFKNDLSWTRPWGPALALSQMEKMERLWASGVSELRLAAQVADSTQQPQVKRELGIASALLSCIRSTINIGRFYMLREQLRADMDKQQAREILNSMEQVAKDELENTRQVLPYVKADSRLGYANSGKNDQTGVPRAGIYSPGSIEKKILQVEHILLYDMPEYKTAHGLN